MTEIKKIGNLTTVSSIFHIGDIHIRNLRRHTEYKIQFKKLYKEIEAKKDANSIIVIAGDLVHTKTDMSPELIEVTSDFLNTLCLLAPTILIPGNHDANLNNPDRLDALTPIAGNLKNPNLYYLKESGLYQFGNIIFSVMSILDPKEKYILADQIEVPGIRVALFHGPVTNASTSVGYHIHGHTDTKLFHGFDLVLLGDIHKYQFMDDKKTIAYCSSLIQQNHGESYDDHGYLYWQLPEITSSFHHLDNDYGFHTLFLVDGKLVPYKEELITSKSKVRIKVTNTSDQIVKETISKLKHDHQLAEVSIARVDPIAANNSINLTRSGNIDVRNIDVQNQLISDYLNLTMNLSLDKDLMDSIYAINRKINLLLENKNEIIRNVVWKPKKFEFSNMFSYGEGNAVNFENLKGIQGLFGPNASGKSSLLDALCFCLFDTTSRAYKAEKILNTKKDWFECKFNFEIDGVDYFILKRGTKSANTGKVKVNIDFWKVDSQGIRTNLNGEQRRETDSNICSYIGSYDDFTLMCLSIQNNGTNFVDKSQTERKEILAKFLDLNVFESLQFLANVECKKIATLIENANIKELEFQLEDLQKSTKNKNANYKSLTKDIKKLNTLILKKGNEIVDLTRQIKNIESIDIDELQKLSIEKINAIYELEQKKVAILELETTCNSELETAEKEYSKIDTNQVQADLILFQTKQKELGKLIVYLDKLELAFGAKNAKLENLAKHEYDPNCKFCINNVFVKDAINTKEEIEYDAAHIKEVKTNIEFLESDIEKLGDIETTSSTVSNLESSINKLTQTKQKIEISKLKLDNDILELKNSLIEIESKVKLYENNKLVIDANKTLEEQIETVEQELETLKQKHSTLSNDQLELYSSIKVNENKILSVSDKMLEINRLLKEKEAYEYYLTCVDKNGISYQLISKIVPKIENEINNILANLVDFRIILDTDGKNVNAYIVYENKFWALELSSGMERFISAIAIRVALINISSLPKPTFFAIDEGLGVLDSTNLNQIYLFFNYIRDIFDFTLVISHIDIVKDMVDNTLTIENDNGFSKLILN